MKARHLLMAALLPMTALAEEATDTTLVVNNRKYVINDSTEKVSVQVFELDGTEYKKAFEGHYTNGQEEERVYVTSPFFPKKKKFSQFYPSIPTVWIGFNVLTDGTFSMSKADDMHPRNSKSWEWGINFATVGSTLSKNNNFGMAVNLQLINTHNHFSDNYILTRDDNGNVAIQQRGEQLKKSYISYWTLSVPILFEWKKKLGHSKFFVGVGPALNLNFSDHSRYKIGKDKRTETSDINLNVFSLGLDAYIGYGDISIFVRKALTPLLDKSHSPECFPLTVSIAL